MADAYGFLSWISRNSERVERWEWGMSGPVDPRVGRDENKIHSKEILEFFIDVDLQSSVFFFFFLIRLILRRELIVYIGALLSAPPAFTSYFAFFLFLLTPCVRLPPGRHQSRRESIKRRSRASEIKGEEMKKKKREGNKTDSGRECDEVCKSEKSITALWDEHNFDDI